MPSAKPASPERRWSTALLLAGSSEAVIEHQGEIYRLRRTSKGGLILTK